MTKIQIFIVDDHKIVIDGIASFLLGNNNFELIGSATSAQELFDSLKQLEYPLSSNFIVGIELEFIQS